MSQSLTAKYRPQRFDEVAGQETVKAVLSRAALEDRIAPAYLFSGTRGVGKTTLARIFAKAVNCVNAPTAEPCNECVHCRQITQGAAVDVIEIDGASNRGIDDARRLREDIGYAPMECRYKVFIIDEAHMLTKEAFNALLKTLEEPPPNVTFVLATTESHKFPATIISRCQHFVFKRLPAPRLMDHLRAILDKESVEYEEAALALIAKRAAGSVRDSMSLMGQVIALGSGPLRSEDVRSVLGLAGQEIYFELLESIHGQDPVGVSRVLGQILDQGLDLGFFLRELVTVWRTLFLLKQSGEAAIPLLDLAEEEAAGWMEWAQKLELAHIHAAWQMTLEGQRRVLTSLEPALALELLLVNLAFLPRLVPLENLPAAPSAGGAGGGTGQSGGSGGAASPGNFSGPQGPAGAPPSGGHPAPGAPRDAAPAAPRSAPAQPADQQPPHPSPQNRSHQAPSGPRPAPAAPRPGYAGNGAAPQQPAQQHAPRPAPAPQPARQTAPASHPSDTPAGAPQSAQNNGSHAQEPPPWVDDGPADDYSFGGPPPGHPAAAGGEPPLREAPPTPPEYAEQAGQEREYPSGWTGFMARYRDAGGEDGPTVLMHTRGELDGGVLTIYCKSTFHKDQVEEQQHWRFLAPLVALHYGPDVRIEVVSENGEFVHQKELRDEVRSRPLVQGIMEELDAQFVNCHPVKPSQKPGGRSENGSSDG
ncbi:DNA polymerase III subunit gamma/tau [Oceanidesulfovibrio marinus]|uniref:DNA polymerase III subunit gamma/tau n=1 Tax=Oceanidesulfovibrio marinus TaxID=370038 RepID=A0ABX6NKG0_9BACT|nr:DNA polymerase III subunit gamma/tau [Oceanidesulfovibrio marinus]QJT10523.1 DNA polymerase III subunit gamma/tau [Oceanidesulfovibrio marinus]